MANSRLKWGEMNVLVSNKIRWTRSDQVRNNLQQLSLSANSTIVFILKNRCWVKREIIGHGHQNNLHAASECDIIYCLQTFKTSCTIQLVGKIGIQTAMMKTFLQIFFNSFSDEVRNSTSTNSEEFEKPKTAMKLVKCKQYGEFLTVETDTAEVCLERSIEFMVS